MALLHKNNTKLFRSLHDPESAPRLKEVFDNLRNLGICATLIGAGVLAHTKSTGLIVALAAYSIEATGYGLSALWVLQSIDFVQKLFYHLTGCSGVESTTHSVAFNLAFFVLILLPAMIVGSLWCCSTRLCSAQRVADPSICYVLGIG